MSRVHCEVHVRGDAITLRDLGSTNGTFVEGVRLRDGDVRPGALVRVGGSAFRVERGEEASFLEVSSQASFGELVGSSLEMRRLYAILEKVAGGDATVLVQGETGTGKDVLARSLHAASRRRAGPFVAVDCGAIPENLVESELFGHARGAFTGASDGRAGMFEEASGGTLFLDEIGEMPLALQPKLLRAIESRAIRRVGTTKERPVDVRIVAATNRLLSRCVNEGTFREDLYYRLAVVEVELPPLRARPADVPLLAQHFYAQLTGDERALLPPELTEQLVLRGWPGNVRELRNFIERSVSLGTFATPRAAPRHVSPIATAAAESVVPLHLPLKEARQAWTESFENVYVRALLQKNGGNVTRTAERAGVGRRFLQRLIARLGIRPAEVGADPKDFADE